MLLHYFKVLRRKEVFFGFPLVRIGLIFYTTRDKGYLLLGMENQTKAIAISIKKFDEIKDKLNIKYNKEKDNIDWWYVEITKIDEIFSLKLKKGETLDLSPYLLDIT